MTTLLTRLVLIAVSSSIWASFNNNTNVESIFYLLAFTMVKQKIIKQLNLVKIYDSIWLIENIFQCFN